MKKLLLIGSNSVHTYNYYNLIADYFDKILLITQKGHVLENIPTIQLNFSLKNPVNVLSTIYSIRKQIENFQPSVIHVLQANTFSFLTLVTAQKYNLSVIITALGSDILLAPQWGWVYKKMIQYNLRNANYFTSDSKFMAEEMQRLIPEKKLDITIANFGINITPENVPKENIIYSNRLHKKLYRIDKVIEIFNNFSKNRVAENWQLIIAGIGEETEQLKELVKKLQIDNKVKFIGWVNAETNSNYYNRAKIFISIPESDATAISLLEAMACGCIPIVSDLPANREWIIDKLNGIIVTNLSENFLDRATELDTTKVTAINQKIIAEQGTREASKKKFIQLYEKILQR